MHQRIVVNSQQKFNLKNACFKEDVEAVKYLVPFASKMEDKVRPACSMLEWSLTADCKFLAQLFSLHE